MKKRPSTTTKTKRRAAPRTAAGRGPSIQKLQEQLDRRTRELAEALEQQGATSEVLQIISSSPGELQPVFDAMLANVARICEAKFAILYLCEGDAFRAVAAT